MVHNSRTARMNGWRGQFWLHLYLKSYRLVLQGNFTLLAMAQNRNYTCQHSANGSSSFTPPGENRLRDSAMCMTSEKFQRKQSISNLGFLSTNLVLLDIGTRAKTFFNFKIRVAKLHVVYFWYRRTSCYLHQARAKVIYFFLFSDQNMTEIKLLHIYIRGMFSSSWVF